jgi:hypothetical protein
MTLVAQIRNPNNPKPKTEVINDSQNQSVPGGGQNVGP